MDSAATHVPALMLSPAFRLPGLGPFAQWPVTLRVAVGLMNDSLLPMSLVWGPQRLLLYNDAYASFMGERHPAALGQRLDEVWPDIWPQLGPVVDKARGGESFHVEDLCLYVRRGHGEERAWFTFYYSPLRDETGQVAGMCSSVVETTARVLAERRQTALLMLNDALGSAGDANDILAAATWTLQDYLDRCAVTFTPAVTATAATGAIHVPLQPGKDAGFFAIALQGAASWTALDQLFAEEVARCAAAAIDRLASAKALMAASEGERRFRLMADAAPQIVWTTDSGGGVEFFNKQWFAYTGIAFAPRTSHEATERVVHPDDRARTLAGLEAARREHSPFQVEHRLRAADGQYRWFLARAVPYRDPRTRQVRWFGVSTDIHERKLAEVALQQEDRRKDEFLATLAHELRNPLAPVRTGLQILRMCTSQDNRMAMSTLATMDRQIGHMVHLIDDLLDVARIRSGQVALQRGRHSLQTVIDSALEGSRHLIEAAGHALTVLLPPQPIHIDADLTRMAQALGNLLNNAAKFTPDGGRIELRVRREGPQVAIRVTDSGVGIAQAKQARVFDMFAQLDSVIDRAKGGLGIGLSITRRLVELHGGTISVSSEGVGRGASFELRLPVAPEPAAPARAAAEREAEADACRVLVVDDNIDAAETLALMLNLMGHEACTAHCGADALQAAHDFSPAVVLCDIGMPGMNGYEVARRLRADPELSGATLVALTGWGDDEAQKRSLDAGFDLHLTKPVDLAQLTQAMTCRAPANHP